MPRQTSRPLGFFGAVTFFDGARDEQRYAVGGVWEITPAAPISVCPNVTVEYADVENGGTAFSIPIGIGLGTDVPLVGADFMPYVVPALIWSHFDADDGLFPGVDSESQVDIGVSGGVLLGFGSFFFGGTVQHVFAGGADPVFGIRAGIRL